MGSFHCIFHSPNVMKACICATVLRANFLQLSRLQRKAKKMPGDNLRCQELEVEEHCSNRPSWLGLHIGCGLYSPVHCSILQHAF